MGDIVLFPHCDLHMAVGGDPSPPLRVRVMWREPNEDRTRYTLSDITASCRFDFFSPYRPPGQRFNDLPTVDPTTGLVTAVLPGIYLFQVLTHEAVSGSYHHLVGRLQVHQDVLDWWFGNTSITTALDPDVAHAQPTIYASFSEDLATGTDIVGDITGHDYVSLTSSAPSLFTVDSNGRLTGLAETPPAGSFLVGDFLGRPPQHLPVHVVDYGQTRFDLRRVPAARKDGAPTHHLLLLAEGFRDGPDDRARFDKITRRLVDELSTKPRHSPFDLLLDGDVAAWSAFAPSRESGVTYGFHVNETAVAGVLPAGAPIPYNGRLPFGNEDDPYRKYMVDELVERVGLPRRGENRSHDQLLALWSSPEAALPDFEPFRVDEPLVEAWRAQTFDAVFTDRDTFFGYSFGRRLGDRSSSESATAVVPPDAVLPDRDSPTQPHLEPFVARVYEFFAIDSWHSVRPDRRRHPPERLGNDVPPGISIMRYVAGLHTGQGNLGQVWVPEWQPERDDWALKPSRGLVGILCNDERYGGAAYGGAFMGASLGDEVVARYTNTVVGHQRRRVRVIDPAPAMRADFIDTVAHEFGHILNLGDEYEVRRGDDVDAAANVDQRYPYDNVDALSWLYVNPPVTGPDGMPRFPDKFIQPDEVKWLWLVRPKVPSALLSPSEAGPLGVRLIIDKQYVAMWERAEARGEPAFLRAPTGEPWQLPLRGDEIAVLEDREILRVDPDGAVTIAGPPPASPFPAGSLLFVPHRRADPTGGTDLVYVTERRVLARLRSTLLPLNADPDVSEAKRGIDLPDVDVPSPLAAYKLIGVYEGAGYWAGSRYRPAGACKMRDHDVEFCHVCKYLIVNRINPSLHAKLDALRYPFLGSPLD